MSTSIALVFDRPIDPASVDADQLVIEPDVAGTLDVVALAGEEPVEGEPDGSGRMLRFTPSGPLPPNTTFAVELGPGLAAVDGGELAEATAWTFITAAPPSTLSNQITFVTDRAGVANVWAWMRRLMPEKCESVWGGWEKVRRLNGARTIGPRWSWPCAKG